MVTKAPLDGNAARSSAAMIRFARETGLDEVGFWPDNFFLILICLGTKWSTGKSFTGNGSDVPQTRPLNYILQQVSDETSPFSDGDLVRIAAFAQSSRYPAE